MSDQTDDVPQRPGRFSKKSVLALTALLLLILPTLFYVATRGGDGTKTMAVTNPDADPQKQPGNEQQDGTPSLVGQQDVTPSPDVATGDPEAGITALPLLDKVRSMLSNKRVLIAGIAVTLTLVTLAAIFAALYYSSQMESLDIIEREKQMLEEQRQREEQLRKEEAEKAARKLLVWLSVGSLVANTVLSIIFIYLSRSMYRLSLKENAVAFIVSVCLLQGIAVLLFIIFIGIYNAGQRYLSRRRNFFTRLFAILFSSFAVLLAMASAVVCLPVFLCLSFFVVDFSPLRVITKLASVLLKTLLFILESEPMCKIELEDLG